MVRSNTGADNVIGVETDDGGRPITDRGGRLVLKTGALDPEGTPPLEPTGATGTDLDPEPAAAPDPPSSET